MNVYEEAVKHMVDTDVIVINTGLFEYKGKKYVLVAELREKKE